MTVGIYFSGSNHYTSAGIVVRTTKINSNSDVRCNESVNNLDSRKKIKDSVTYPLSLLLDL